LRLDAPLDYVPTYLHRQLGRWLDQRSIPLFAGQLLWQCVKNANEYAVRIFLFVPSNAIA
jgi:hypothetical protein